MIFNKNVLRINVETEMDRLIGFIRENLALQKKSGLVVGLSGGIDSAVITAIAVKAIGKENVFGLVLPEKESNPISKEYALKHAKCLGIEHEVMEITPVLEAFGTYKKRDEVISSLYPEYRSSEHRIKISLPSNILEQDSLNIFSLSISDGTEEIFSKRLRKWDMKKIVAATDTKQRTRMMYLYYKAEALDRLVCGTTNRPETLQGFFVKYGDGGVDLEPIAHLYKTQVYQLAQYLDVIPEIIEREPSPDTYNSFVTDEDFFFRMSYDNVDHLLYAWENDVPVLDVCRVMDLSKEQVERAFRDFRSKYKTTEFLRNLPPSLL